MSYFEIFDMPVCENIDCSLNVLGLCHSIDTILARIPSGIVTCSGAVYEFNENYNSEQWANARCGKDEIK